MKKLSVVLAVVMLTACLFSGCGGSSSAKGCVQTYLDGYMKFNAKKVAKVSIEMSEKLNEDYNPDYDDRDFERAREDAMEDLEDDFEDREEDHDDYKKYKRSYKITKVINWSEDAIDDYVDKYDNTSYEDIAFAIEDISTVYFYATTEYKEKKNDDVSFSAGASSLDVCKIDGSWYILDFGWLS